MLVVLAELGHEPLQRTAQGPLAQVELGLREGGAHGPVEPVVVVADDPRRRALEGAQERLPAGPGCVGGGLDAPEPRATALEARRAEDPEGDPEAPGGGVTHREGKVVEQERPRLRPGRGPVGLEDDGAKTSTQSPTGCP